MAVTLSPYQDPSFLAFLRSTGIEESEIAGEVQRRTSALTRGLSRRQPLYAERKEEGLAQEGDRYENDGMYRSGARLVAQQKVANSIDRQSLEDELGVRENIADLEGNASRNVARLRRGVTEEELNARGRVSEDAAYGGIR